MFQLKTVEKTSKVLGAKWNSKNVRKVDQPEYQGGEGDKCTGEQKTF